MRWSKTLAPTLRNEPQEAEIPSHKLLLRAGLVRRLAGGLYTFLPLGLRTLRKVETIVREEMDRAGALEVLMPAMQPRDIWDRSGRFDSMHDVMFHLNDRANREHVLGPTHEEVTTSLIAGEIESYRQLPRTLYQIQTKFRDEIRPRFGLMRAKEFIMKDAYSFDLGWDEADTSYQAMYDAYHNIFQRCGLRVKVVEADTGTMGGQWSHEFMVLADAGEDGIVECDACEYAANLERAERLIAEAPAPPATHPEPTRVDTPGVRTIQDVATFLKCKPSALIKTLIYLIDGTPTAVYVPGDREVNEIKLRNVLSATQVELADDATITRVTGAPLGFAGPVGLDIPGCADLALKGKQHAIGGANAADTHLTGIQFDRDATVATFGDLCFAKEGDACPRCVDGKLREKRGIEVGHVFKLGTKYSEAFGATYLDAEGQTQSIVMGCYGIGVTRTLQSIIEQSHDKAGIIWPMAVAPYRVGLLLLDPKEPQCVELSETLMAELEAEGIDCLLDDRDERPGVKFKDADLIGYPVRVVIGARGLKQAAIEIKLRTEKEPEMVPIPDAAARIKALCTL